jgi:Tol biopolymer transport system component
MRLPRSIVAAAVACTLFVAASAAWAAHLGQGAGRTDDALVAFTGGSTRGPEDRASIYVVRADGSRLRAVTHNTARGGDFSPAWSPDGKRIAFARSTNAWRSYEIWVVGANGKGLRRLTRAAGINEHPTWSPDGRWIAFSRLVLGRPGCYGPDLYVVGADGRGLRAVVRSPVAARESDRGGGVSTPAWSPDGRLIAYASDRRGTDPTIMDVYVVRANGKGKRLLARNALDPAWSPDGERVAFTRAGRLYTVTVDGRQVRRLAAVRGSQPAWSSDGRSVAFDAVRGREPHSVYVMTAGGRAVHKLLRTRSVWSHSPAWQPVR